MNKIKKQQKIGFFKAIIGLGILAFYIGNIKAQDTLVNHQDTLVVFNLYATFSSQIESEAEDTSSVIHPIDSTMTLNIGFKVSFPGSIDRMFVLVGSQKDSSDYHSANLSVIKEDGINSIYQNNTKISRFWKRDATYSLTVFIRDFARLKWLTLYVKDKDGKFSKRKYFKIQ